ncbi:MAG: hypothetical protein CL928_18660 [Deltaproteobacteria bacterium]|nr:hypothetical protein [Deltaproteobacteria bacterium]
MTTRCSYVDTPDGQLHLRMAGLRTKAPPVVLLHQTASHSVMFEGVMEFLGSRYWCVAPDTPGYGNTPHPRGTGSIALYARVLRAALDALGIQRCWLFGHHTGASIAVQMATDDPTFAVRLALSGPPCLNREQIETLIPKAAPKRLEEDGSHFMAVWNRIRAKAPTADVALLHREAVSNLQVGPRYLEAYRAVFAQDFEGQLADLDVETLVMAGPDDTLRDSLEPAHEALQQGYLLELPRGGTYVCDTHPELIAGALSDFFTPSPVQRKQRAS